MSKGGSGRIPLKQWDLAFAGYLGGDCRLLVGFHVFGKGQVASLGNLSKWAFLLTFAGVRLRTNFRDMSKQGLRPFIVGVIGEILIACLTFGLVVGANRTWGL